MSSPDVLRCAIIDDDVATRLLLERYIALSPPLKLVSSLADGVEGLEFFRAGGTVDLLFLDVEMPNLSGLDFLQVVHKLPHVVLVTAHERFAVTAFALQVADYLVKPVSFSRFCQAVERVMTLHGAAPCEGVATAGAVGAPIEAPTVLDNHAIFVKVNSRLIRVNYTDILYVEALSDHIQLVTESHKYIVYMRLREFCDRVSAASFMRIHRSYALNLDKIVFIENNTVRLSNSAELPIGVSFQDEFIRRLKQIV